MHVAFENAGAGYPELKLHTGFEQKGVAREKIKFVAFGGDGVPDAWLQSLQGRLKEAMILLYAITTRVT